jgi:quercetin dioxygenase-like cupin family protein
MTRLLNASLIACALILALPAAAQEEGPPVPVDKAPFHVPVFRNDYVALVNVYIPAGRMAGYHIHSLDQISVLVGDADMVGQVLGSEPTPARRNPRGNVNFVAYSKKALTHRVSNVGPTPFHNVVLSIVYPEPGRFTPGSRADVAGYTQILDNERVRGWRLVLEPGQTAAAISQKAPGIRVVVDGGEIVESVPGAADRGMALKTGDFFWQEPGVTRAVRNGGTSRIQLVEFELK